MNKGKGELLGIVVLVILLLSLLVTVVFGSAGIGGAIQYSHLNLPQNIPLSQEVIIKLGLADQLGQPLLGKSYGDINTPGTYFIEKIADKDGNVATFTVNTAAITESNGIYSIPITITDFGIIAEDSLIEIQAGYVGDTSPPENSTSLDYKVNVSALTKSGATPDSTILGFIGNQIDKVVLQGTSSGAITLKLTSYEGKAVDTLGGADFSIISAINQNGIPVSITLGSVETLSSGVYKIPFTTASLNAGDLLSIGIKVNYNGFDLKSYTTINIGSAEVASEKNLWFVSPYFDASDTLGPATTGLTLSTTLSNAQKDVTLTGLFDESQTGNTELIQAEYFLSTLGTDGTGINIPLTAGKNKSNFSVTISNDQLNALSDGVHTIYVHAKDVNGNWGAHGTIEITIDKNLITSTITAPTKNQYVRGGAFEVKGTVHNPGGSTIQTVEVSIDGGPWFTATNTGINFNSWKYSLNTTTLFDGVHNVRSRVKTTGDYIEAPDLGANFIVDNTPPNVSITSPADGVLVGGSWDIKGLASDLNLVDWKLEYGVGETPISWAQLATGTDNKYGTVIQQQFSIDFSGGTLTNTQIVDPGVIKLMPPSTVNHALNKFVYASNSSSTKTELSLTNGMDEGYGNGWTLKKSTTTLNEWIIVDCEKEVAISEVKFKDQGWSSILDYKVYLSNTGSFSGEEVEVLSVINRTISSSSLPAKGRFVKVHLLKKSSTSNLNVQELELVGNVPSSGEYVSKVLDAGSIQEWNSIKQTFIKQNNSTIYTQVRIGNTPIPDETWSSWSAELAGENEKLSFGLSRYLQYKVVFRATELDFPEFEGIDFYAGSSLASFDFSALADGLYTFRLTANDKAGSSTQKTSTVTVNNSTATVSLDNLTNGALIPSEFEIKGQYNSTFGIERVEVIVNNSEVYTAKIVDGSNWSYNWDTDSFALGSNVTVKVRLINKNGFITETGETTVAISNQKPFAEISADPVQDSYIGATYNVVGTVTVTDQPLSKYTVEVGRGYQPYTWTKVGEGTTAIINSQIGTIDTSLFTSNVSHTIRVIAEDILGNKAITTRRVYIDNVKPYTYLWTTNMNIGTPNEGKLSSEIRVYDLAAFDRWELLAEWRGNGTNPVTTNAGYTVKATGTNQANPDHWMSTITAGPINFGVDSGWYHFKTQAYDKAGNIGTEAGSGASYYWDPLPPTVTITEPLDGAAFKTGASMPVRITSNDDNYMDSHRLAVNGSNIWSVTGNTKYTNQLVTTYTVSSSLAEGPHKLRATARDKVGYERFHEITFNVDNTAPGGAITNLKDGDFVPGIFEISGNTADNLVGVTKVEYSVDGGAWQLVTGTATFSATVDLSSVTDLSVHNIKLRVTDKAGNVYTDPAGINLTVSTSMPEVIGVSPAELSSNNSAMSEIKINFNKGINLDSAKQGIIVIDSLGFPVEGIVEVYNLGFENYATFKPIMPFRAGIVNVEANLLIKDMYGNPLKQVKNWTFDVKDLMVSISSPPANSYVGGNQAIAGTVFSSDIKDYTVEYAPVTSPTSWSTISFVPGVTVANKSFLHDTTTEFQSGSLTDLKVKGNYLMLQDKSITKSGQGFVSERFTSPSNKGNMVLRRPFTYTKAPNTFAPWKDTTYKWDETTFLTDERDTWYFYTQYDLASQGVTMGNDFTVEYVIDAERRVMASEVQLVSSSGYNRQPTNVKFYVSDDNVNWTYLGEDVRTGYTDKPIMKTSFSDTKGRYFKVVVTINYKDSSYRYLRICRVKVIGYNPEGIVALNNMDVKSGSVEVSTEFPDKKFFDHSIYGTTQEHIIDHSGTTATGMKLFFSRISFYGSQTLNIYRWVNGAFETTPTLTLNTNTTNYWTPVIGSNKVKITFTPSNIISYPSYGIWLDKVSLDGLSNPSFISQFKLDTETKAMDFENIVFKSDQGFANTFRGSTDGTTWSPWVTNISDLPSSSWVQVKSEFSGPLVYTVTPKLKVSEQKLIYAKSAGEFLSPVIDAGVSVNWDSVSWLGSDGSNLLIRVGNSPTPDGTWSNWSNTIHEPISLTGLVGRYAQYKLAVSTNDLYKTFGNVLLNSSPQPLANWDTALVADGEYILRLTATTNGGDSDSVTRNVIVENVKPVLTVTNPIEGGGVGKNTVISGTVSDNLSGLKELNINFNNEGWQLITQTEGNWSTSLDASHLLDGTNTTLQVQAIDKAGNIALVSINVVVDVTLPLTTLITDASPNSNGWFNSHPQITLTANKTGNTYYQWTSDTVTIVPTSGYSLYGEPLTQTDGTFKLWYYTEDAVGNIEETKVATFKIKTQAPIVTVVRPDLANVSYTRNPKAEIGSTNTDLWKAEYSLNGGVWTALTNKWVSGSTTYFTGPTNPLGTIPNGWHNIKYRLYNFAGHMTETTQLDFFVDRHSPDTPIITPSIPAGSWVKNGQSVDLSIRVKDNSWYSNQSGIRWWFLQGTGIEGHTELLTDTYVATVQIKNANPYYVGSGGAYQLYAYDRADNATLSSILTYQIDGAPPLLEITSHDTKKTIFFNNANVATEITVSGSVTDQGSGLDYAEIRFSNGTWQPIVVSGSAWSATLPLPQTEGNYTIEARAFDKVGNQSYSRSLNILIDLTPPTIGKIIAKEDSSLGGINLTWTPSEDSLSGVDHYLIYRNGFSTPINVFYLDGTSAPNERFYANVGVDKFMSSNMPHNYQYKAVDKAGNISGLSNISTALYDTEKPSVPGSLVATTAGVSNTINLDWVHSTDNVALGGYIVERSTDGINFSQIGKTELETNILNRFADRDLAYGQTYYYRVRAFDLRKPTSNISNPSSVVSANTGLGSSFISPHGDYASGDRTAYCARCHSAHAADGKRLLNQSLESSVCYECHDGSGSKYPIKSEIDYNPTHHRVKTLSEPINLLECVDCHDPHATNSTQPKLLRSFDKFGNKRTSGSEYCLSCHGDEAHSPNPGGSQSQYLISTHISTNNPKIAPYPGSKVDCLYCHENHGSPYFRQTIRNEAEICYQCHNDPVNSRSGWNIEAQYNPDLGTNPRASRHGIEAAGATVKCTSCHGQRFITNDAFDSVNSQLGVGSDISNPFNIKEMFTQVDGDFNDFCLACHRSDPPQATSTTDTIIPYSIYYPANDITTSANGWDRTSYKTPGVSHFDKGYSCRKCHEPHGSPYPRLVTMQEDSLTQKGMCFSCHDEKMTDGADNIWEDFQKMYKHPLTAGVHTDGKNYKTIPANQRHASCMDCHDPHTATKRQAIQGSPEGAGTQDNVSGVKVVANGAAGTVPTYAFISSVTLEYELCFKCHSSYAQLPAGKPDLAKDTNPNNPSYHPIQSKAKKSYIRKEAFRPGWGLDSIVKCTDCHGSETGGNGIHGSNNPKLLKKSGSVGRTISASDGSGGTIRVPNPNLLCFDCHDPDTYIGNKTKASRYQHQSENTHSTCNMCHAPHGSTTAPALLDTQWVGYQQVNATTHRIVFKCASCHPSIDYFRTY